MSAIGQVCAQSTQTADDRVVVVGNPAQPVQWLHRPTIQSAIKQAQPNGTVIIPANYTGTDCTPITSCNPGSVIVLDWRTSVQAGGTFGALSASLGFQALPPSLPYLAITQDPTGLCQYWLGPFDPNEGNTTLCYEGAGQIWANSGTGPAMVLLVRPPTTALVGGMAPVFNAVTGQFEFTPILNGQLPTTIVYNNQSNTYALGSQQIFPVDSNLATLVLGTTNTDPCCSVPTGSMWINMTALSSHAPHVNLWAGDSPVSNLNNGDGPWDMVNGVTGPQTIPGGAKNPTVLAYGATLTNPFLSNPTVDQLTILNKHQDLWRFYNGSTDTSCTQTPASGQLAACKDSGTDALKLSYGDTFHPAGRVIQSGTAAMTVAAIGSGACGTTVTVGATGVLTTDTINISNNAAVTANNGVLITHWWPTAGNVNFNYCNPTAGSITPTSATLNWSVTR